MPQIRHDLDAVQAGVLRQRRRHNFHGVRKRLPANGLGPAEFARLFGQGGRDGDFGSAASCDERTFLHQAPDHAERVVEGTLGFVQNQAVGAADENGDGVAGQFVRDAGQFHDARARRLGFLQQFGTAEFVFGKGLDVSYGFATCGLFENKI